jgi:hypothetical protein
LILSKLLILKKNHLFINKKYFIILDKILLSIINQKFGTIKKNRKIWNHKIKRLIYLEKKYILIYFYYLIKVGYLL